MQRIAIFRKWIQEMFKDQNIIFKKLEKFTKDKLLETMYKYK
jgi:hypothetical protein